MITPLSKWARLLFAGILTILFAPPVFAQQTGEQPSKAPEASQPMPTLQHPGAPKSAQQIPCQKRPHLVPPKAE